MEKSAIELFEANPAAIYVIQVHGLDPGLEEEVVPAQALILLRREGGLLLAVPAGAFSDEVLAAAAEGDPFLAFGAHATFTIRLVSPEGVQGEDAEVIVIDAEMPVLAHLNRLPDPVPPEVMTFGADPFMLPDPVVLMQLARDWIAQAQEVQQLAFYSAAEEEQANGMEGNTPKAPPLPETGAKAKQKRVTTASLAEQMAELSGVLPTLTQQLQVLQQGQEELKFRMDAQASTPPPRPSQLPVSAPLQTFAKMMGSPPRTRAGTVQPKTSAPHPMTTTEMVDGVEVEKNPGRAGTVKSPDKFGESIVSGRRSASRCAARVLDNSIGVQRGPRSREAAVGAREQIRRLLPVSPPERLQEDETGLQGAYNHPSCPRSGYLHGKLLGTIRRLRAVARNGAGAMESSPHLRLCLARGPGGCERACCPSDDSSGTGGAGQQQVGPGIPTDTARGASFSALGLQTCSDAVAAEGFRALVCPTMGHDSPCICEGSGLHSESEGGGHQEAASSAISRCGPSSKAEAKEEAKMARRRSRKQRQQERKRGMKGSPVVGLDHLEPSNLQVGSSQV